MQRLQASELRPDLRDALAARIERLGYLGEFFRLAAHEPDVLLAFMTFTDALKSALPPDRTELIALTVARRLGNAYEQHQHERLCIALGFEREWVMEVLRLEPVSAHAMTVEQRRLQSLTIAVINRNGHGVTQELAEVVELMSPRTVVAALLTIGRYVTHSYFVNAFELQPPVSSMLEPS